MSLNIFEILLYYYICLFTTFYYLSALVGCWSSVSIRRIIYKFLSVCPFITRLLRGYWEGWALVNRINVISGVTAVTPTDRPKSVRNRCVIKVFDGILCCLVAFSVGVEAFVIGLSQISSFFLSCTCVWNNWKGLVVLCDRGLLVFAACTWLTLVSQAPCIQCNSSLAVIERRTVKMDMCMSWFTSFLWTRSCSEKRAASEDYIMKIFCPTAVFDPSFFKI